MTKETSKPSFLKKGGRVGALIGFIWVALNIVIPLALLRIPAVQRSLVALNNRLPFDIPGIS